MAYILETMALTKMYGQKAAAKDINMHIEEGKIYGLIGRNGAGKTTIMRMISGLSTPTSGSYSLFGETGLKMKRMLKNVGVLIEHPGLFPKLSGYENLKIKCLGLGIKPKGYVEELMKTVGFKPEDADKKADSYSLGMRQRLGIALALIGEPKLLVLDEPINGLDPQGIVEVRRILARLRDERGISVMISSHILDELSKLADVYGIISEGCLIDEFTTDELESRTGLCVMIRSGEGQKTLDVLKGIGITKAAIDKEGLVRVEERLEETAAMAEAIIRAGIPLHEIYHHNATLEDYYLSKTGGNVNA